MRSFARVLLVAIFVLCRGGFSNATDVDPNEQHPITGVALYEKSNHGAYLSVGSERSFMGAAFTRAAALYVVDLDPQILKFVTTNTALLAVSLSRVDYLHLRLEASSAEWAQRAAQLTGERKSSLSEPSNYDWWVKTVRQSSFGFKLLATRPRSPEDAFYGFSYLYDDALFQHLKDLAAEGKIASSLADLTHPDEMDAVLKNLTAKGYPLGVVDTSNVPDDYWAGPEKTVAYFRQIQKYSRPDTLFLNTNDWVYPCWSYYAFTSDYISHLSDQSLLESLKSIVNETGQPGFKSIFNNDHLAVAPEVKCVPVDPKLLTKNDPVPAM